MRKFTNLMLKNNIQNNINKFTLKNNYHTGNSGVLCDASDPKVSEAFEEFNKINHKQISQEIIIQKFENTNISTKNKWTEGVTSFNYNLDKPLSK